MQISAPKQMVPLPFDSLKQAQHSPKLDFVAVGTLFGIIVVYLGLVPLGQWQSDEYDYFGKLRHGIGSAVAARLWWSPRPVSEFLYGAYGLLANYFHRPFIGSFLACLWLGLLLCACATAIQGCLGKRTTPLPDLLIGLGLAAAFVTSGPLFQVFYWPAGAVAYLPTLSVTLLLFLQVSSGALSTPRGRWLCGVCLMVAALSTEIGAILAVCFGFLEIADASLSPRGKGRAYPGTILWWLLPVIAGVAVLWWAAAHRIPVPGSGLSVGLGQGEDATTRATAAARELVLELLGFSTQAKQPLSAIPTLLSRVLIGVGVALLWSRRNGGSSTEGKRTQRQLIMLACALIGACFGALFATYPQFGLAGSERYETLRRCWMLMTFPAVAGVVLQAHRGRRLLPNLSPSFGPILLIIGVLLPWHVSPLQREYPVYSAVLRATRRNFQSGYQRDAQQMTFVVPPNRGVITPQTLEPGAYTPTAPPTQNNYAGNVLAYFGKEVLVVRKSSDAAQPPH